MFDGTDTSDLHRRVWFVGTGVVDTLVVRLGIFASLNCPSTNVYPWSQVGTIIIPSSFRLFESPSRLVGPHLCPSLSSFRSGPRSLPLGSSTLSGPTVSLQEVTDRVVRLRTFGLSSPVSYPPTVVAAAFRPSLVLSSRRREKPETKPPHVRGCRHCLCRHCRW